MRECLAKAPSDTYVLSAYLFRWNMGRFTNRLYRFFYGRNGNDKLNVFLIVLTLVLEGADFLTQWLLPDSLFKIIWGLALSSLCTFLFIWWFFRMMSRNRYKRMKENERFLAILGGIRRAFTLKTSRGTKSGNTDNADFIFRDCTKCRATLRLPRKTGKNRVKCPRCSHRFYVK